MIHSRALYTLSRTLGWLDYIARECRPVYADLLYVQIHSANTLHRTTYLYENAITFIDTLRCRRIQHKGWSWHGSEI